MFYLDIVTIFNPLHNVLWDMLMEGKSNPLDTQD